MRSHGYITMGVGKLWHWEPIGEPFTRGTGAHFPKWGTYPKNGAAATRTPGGGARLERGGAGRRHRDGARLPDEGSR